MKRMNNKGISTIEVLLSFVLITIITASMFGTISAFNEKRMIEQYKSEIYTYKNNVTRVIQDDLIKKGLTRATYKQELSLSRAVYTIDFDFKNGERTRLIIKKVYANSEYHITGGSCDDEFVISYGSIDSYGNAIDMTEYRLPDVGHDTNDAGHTYYDLSINNVQVSISEDYILAIHIGFYHPELLTRYGIDIVCPINYVSSGKDSSTNFELY